MTSGRIQHLIHYLRRTAAPADGSVVSDAQLLERFAAGGDEAAFELLARRHGPMVLGVCRRVLGDPHDAEDAFQAAFLLLARKTASAARSRSVGGWLYTVAHRVALRARARRTARATHERSLHEFPAVAVSGPAAEATWRELRWVIDEELSRLPERYRVPFVLFHLEGRSSAEVARELGCPVGTVESWLTRARQRLRARLTRRGYAPAPGSLVALAPQEAWLPRAVASALTAARGAASAKAVALAAEAVRAFGLTRTRVAVMVLLLTAAAAAAGLAVRTPRRPAAPAPPEAPRAAQAAERLAPGAPVKLRPFPNAHLRSVTTLALSADGKTLASGGRDFPLILWDVDARKERALLTAANGSPQWVDSAAFSPDGKTLALGDFPDQIISLWDVGAVKRKATLPESVFVYSIAFSPDGKALASAGGLQPDAFKGYWAFEDVPRKAGKELAEVKVWDLATRKARTFYRGDTGRVMSVAFSPDGKTLAAGMRDGAVRLWDVATGKERLCLREKDRGVVNAVAFSPDGKTLAVALGCPDLPVPGPDTFQKLEKMLRERKDRVTLLDAASGRVRARLEGHAGRVEALAFSPDGTLATAAVVPPRDTGKPNDATGEVRLWDSTTGRLRGSPLTCPHTISSVAFGDGGRLLAVAGSVSTGRGEITRRGEITLWDLGPRRGKAPWVWPPR
jgi:RNA polymerase sigma factor (sigma-70 family)